MEASALWISHSTSISGVALLSSNKKWKWQIAFKKNLPSIDSRRCFVVKNVASKKKTKKLEDPSPSLEEEQGSKSFLEILNVFNLIKFPFLLHVVS